MNNNNLNATVDDAIQKQKAAGASNPRLSTEHRIHLCRECIEAVAGESDHWAETAAEAKGLSRDSAIRAEDILSGPAVVVRQLQLTIQTLTAISNGGTPNLPGNVTELKNGQLSVPVVPTHGFFDSLTFYGLKGQVRMQPGVTRDSLHGNRVNEAREGRDRGIAGVLGAGNVSSIPATDSLNKIMFEGRRVVLKTNPVNEYLAPIFERVFAPLIRENLLTVLTGGAEVGAALVNHPDIDEVHITGSSATHDMIVWGQDAEERKRRKESGDPVLQKTITSELGNVTPWIIVPGKYSKGQLHAQAKQVAASITNNASFNCLATKAVITWDQWPQRDEFLSLVNHYLNQTPLRPAYYPGAEDRYRQFSGTETSLDDNGALPWTLLTSQTFDERPDLFEVESFVCVCAETSLSATSPDSFLDAATEFVNNQMTGTLCASVTMPSGFRRLSSGTAERSLHRLKYGSVCINQWSGLAYGFTSPPWGAYPGETLDSIQSGIGSVHNTYLLDEFEKTILEGPLINTPKPVWFPDHKNAVNVAKQLLAFYRNPSLLRLPPLLSAAIRG